MLLAVPLCDTKCFVWLFFTAKWNLVVMYLYCWLNVAACYCYLEQDPELMAAFKDPEVMAALQDGTFLSVL